VIRPRIVRAVAGSEPADKDLFEASPFPFAFQDALALAGISFPLFTEAEKTEDHPYVCYPQTEVKRSLFFPEEIRHLLLQGMERVTTGAKGTARASVISRLSDNPAGVRDYLALQGQIIGKTGTAEILYKHTLDSDTRAKIMNHVWFGAVSFPPSTHPLITREPELVVVVYLRFKEAGKQAVPIGAQIIKKWKELCQNNGSSGGAPP